MHSTKRLPALVVLLLGAVDHSSASNCRPRKSSSSLLSSVSATSSVSSISSIPLASSSSSASSSVSSLAFYSASSSSSSVSSSASNSGSSSASSSSSPSSALPTAINLIANPGFDNLTDDASSPPLPWIFAGGSFSLSDTEFVSAPYAASSSYDTGGGYVGFSISQAVDESLWEPGVPYNVSAWVLTTGGNCDDAEIGCAYTVSTTPEFMFASYESYSMYAATAGTWSEISAVCYPSAANLANDPGVTVIVSCQGGSSWIDNVTLTAAPDVSIALPSTANGILNPGFDDLADDATGRATPWVYTISAGLPITLSSDAGTYLSEPYSLAMNFTSTTTAVESSVEQPILETFWDYAYSYNFTFSMYISSNSPDDTGDCTYVYWGFTETFMTDPSYLTLYSEKDTTVAGVLDTWMTRSVVFSPSDNGVSMSAEYGGTLGIRVQPSCTDATVYLDDFSLEPVLPFVW